jgi:hypothetical protein
LSYIRGRKRNIATDDRRPADAVDEDIDDVDSEDVDQKGTGLAFSRPQKVKRSRGDSVICKKIKWLKY